ncbi:hypothetical protein HDV64DRAFT_131053 [Trichoderma sp. TUCIM 5745]
MTDFALGFIVLCFLSHYNRTHGATVARQIPARNLLKVIRSNRVGFNTLQILFLFPASDNWLRSLFLPALHTHDYVLPEVACIFYSPESSIQVQ